MNALWRPLQQAVAGPRAVLRDVAGFVHYSVARFIADGCLSAAGALSYTTLVSLVPLIVIALATLSAFPIFSDVREHLLDFLFRHFVPEVGEEAEWWFKYFASTAAQTTAAGAAVIAIMAILLLTTIEDQMDAIWKVSKQRPWMQRILSYWTLLTLGPLLFAMSISLSSYFDAFATTVGLDTRVLTAVSDALRGFANLVPFLLETVAFTLLYCLIPNYPVRWREGFVGGIVAAALIEGLKLGFAYYVAQISTYQTVYGALAGIPIFLLWMYVAWLAILFGAVVAASLPRYRVDEGVPDVSPEGRHLGFSLALLAEMAARSREGGSVRVEELAQHLGVATSAVNAHLTPLREAKFVAPTVDGGYVLARDLAAATLFDLYHALGLPLAADWQGGTEAPWQSRVAGAMRRVAAAEAGAMRMPLIHLVAETNRGRSRPALLRRRADG